MFPTSRELKSQARGAMGAAIPPALVITLAYLALTDLLSQLVGQFVPDPLDQFLMASSAGDMDLAVGYILAGGGLGVFLSVVLLLYRTVMRFGYTLWSLRCIRGQACGFATLVEGFSLVGRILLMELLVFSIMFAFIMGGTFVLMMGLMFLSALAQFVHIGWLILPIILIVVSFVCFTVVISLRFAMVPYQLAHQPELGASAAFNMGTRLMRGRLWPLVKLQLTFVGWQLLCLLLFLGLGTAVLLLQNVTLVGIAPAQEMFQVLVSLIVSSPMAFWTATLFSFPVLVWLTSYYSLSEAAFFQALLERSQPAAAPPVTYTRDSF